MIKIIWAHDECNIDGGYWYCYFFYLATIFIYKIN